MLVIYSVPRRFRRDLLNTYSPSSFLIDRNYYPLISGELVLRSTDRSPGSWILHSGTALPTRQINSGREPNVEGREKHSGRFLETGSPNGNTPFRTSHVLRSTYILYCRYSNGNPINDRLSVNYWNY